jgi:octaprenyl-diphosphate synthase
VVGMSISIDKIKEPVKGELLDFEKHFREAMKSSAPLMDKITYYIIQKKGKQIRPVLVFLSAKMCGTINPSTYVAASLIELLHTATLVHDDVVDDAYMRRGFFSVNALWKNKVAVLVGDYLLSKGLLIALDSQNYNHLHTLSTAVRLMSEGELLQIEKARKLDITEDVYFDIIRQKTASLIAAACKAGAASVTENLDVQNQLWLFGEKLGMAFQIKDDLFDYGDDDIGKPRGIDIKEKKMTLPLIYSLQKCDKSTKRQIIHLVKNENDNQESVKKVIEFVKETGGMEYAVEKMNFFKSEALSILEPLPENPAKQAMNELVEYFTARKL